MQTYHAVERLSGRLSQEDIRKAVARMHQLEDTYLSRNQSAACLLGQNTGKGRSGDGSNGRQIVGIWRGKWVTVMLRREGQRMDAQALGVDRVIA